MYRISASVRLVAVGLFVALSSVLAGCSSEDTGVATGADAKATDQTVSAEIGYMPILPDAQLFVGLEDGSLARAGVTPKLVSFQNGPAMVQALLGGQLDIAYFGIGPTMVARGKGADIKVVASNIIEQISFVALGPLAGYFDDGDPATAFSRFEQDNGRRARISTFPVGSVPQTVLDYWLTRQLGADRDAIDVIYQGASQVQQALLTGAVDGAAILEPVVSIVRERASDARVVASGEDMFPGQPGAVVAVRSAFIEAHPEVVQRLVAAHAAATDKLRSGDESAIDAVHKHVGGGRLERRIVADAVRESADHFVADPNRIIDGTQRMRDFQRETGTLKTDTDIQAMFDTRFYDALDRDPTGGHAAR
ncbi:ABC transporter substrate-binding protein [Salinisphaera sp. T31B1]|uniref:ABC transporter substrate-binding protein n=1 Tax=Salinisphaera sp. T31B1 TaxID=727963 RepID=UPI00333E72CE